MIINTWRRTSSVTFTDRTSPRCEWGEVIFCHRMAHFVLIRCYLQPSLAEALCIYNFFTISTDRTSPRCEWGVKVLCHRMAHYVLIRCFLQPSLAEAPPGCYLRQQYSQGVALHAYPELLSTESRRLSLMMLSSYCIFLIKELWRYINKC